MQSKHLGWLIVAFLFVPGVLFAADWPQWRGPDRTGVSKETGLLKDWPKGGPKLLWTFTDAGAGWSGPAVIGSEFLFALDLKTQQKLWSTGVAAEFTEQRGDGPRGTPTVAGDLLFAV